MSAKVLETFFYYLLTFYRANHRLKKMIYKAICNNNNTNHVADLDNITTLTKNLVIFLYSVLGLIRNITQMT